MRPPRAAPAPLRAGLRRIHREHGVERWPQPAEVQVSAADLSVEEKALILFRHAKAARLPPEPVAVVRRHGREIVDHPHLTPERIRRLVSDRLAPLAAGPAGELAELSALPDDRLAAVIATEIREPTEAMTTSFRALPAEHRALLVALVDAPPGSVGERDLASAMRRHADGGLPRAPGELIDAGGRARDRAGRAGPAGDDRQLARRQLVARVGEGGGRAPRLSPPVHERPGYMPMPW